ncbi:response regulator transcription factor [Erythrobacter sp. SDW2]|uniref:response regulator transcription factor n=1 Tax=Erythrobacter sp. SDW2 TaxID=2907154 RepID=UPI001F26C166|nr:response regulator transcription factor [Erythrobacter sp. SDW2]UIP06686.1 response regulator transcription factor [Erythrobacter sp. SDW2]
MPRTVLLVDDDPHIRQVLAFAFGKAGMQVVEATDGVEALARASECAPDLVVLDINMPAMDGLEVCRRLRAEGEVPILFLSSRDDELDRVLGIELGADDYVVKPFSPREVVARSNAILRRTAGRSGGGADHAAHVTHGLLTLDSDAWEARWGTEEVALTVTEFGLLKALASAPGRIFTRDNLIDHLRGPGFAVTDRTIDSHIRNLRRKFAEVGGEDIVETRTGVGYRLGACTGGAPA